MNNYRRTVAIDFDGVIHAHRAPWTFPEQINDGPVPGAFEFMGRVLAEFNVVIFSARADSPQPRAAICFWLQAHWPAVKVVAGNGESILVGDTWIHITNVKPHAFIYIDDRGWKFEGTFPTLEELRIFDSWTKSKGEPTVEIRNQKITFDLDEIEDDEIGLGNPLERAHPEDE